MRGILADHNNEGHVSLLMAGLQSETWQGLWAHLNLPLLSFADLGLTPDSTDAVVWEACQREDVLLITINRNARGPDSLEMTIRQRNAPHHLPVITLADADRLLHDRAYLTRAVERLLEFLVDIDSYRGAGRLYVPSDCER